MTLPSFAAMLPAEAASTVLGDQKAKTAGGKDVFLTTADIKDSYKVIGIISARSGEVNLDSLNDKLREQAKNMGADGVIGINYFNYSGYIFAFGTAIKIKE